MIRPTTFMGWPLRRVLFSSGEQIICLYCKTGNEPDLALHDINHNVFRLDKQGQIIWQVQRDDSTYAPYNWWEGLHRHARERGEDGAREPFTEIHLEYADGSTSWDNQTYQWRNPCEWKDGCKIWLMGSAYQTYLLDPDTGIAKNVTEWPVRPW